jgi:broad specificity phosphatase PhoE
MDSSLTDREENSDKRIEAQIVILRHGPKLYDNGKSPNGTYQLDPPLSHEGSEEAYKCFSHLLTRFETPVRIVSSPFLRARETAEILRQAILDYTGTQVPIYSNTLLGEFLGNGPKPEAGDLRMETGNPHSVIYEDSIYDMVRMRIPKVHRMTKKQPINTWMISHGIVIQKWTGGRYPGYLEGVYVIDDVQHTISYPFH